MTKHLKILLLFGLALGQDSLKKESDLINWFQKVVQYIWVNIQELRKILPTLKRYKQWLLKAFL